MRASVQLRIRDLLDMVLTFVGNGPTLTLSRLFWDAQVLHRFLKVYSVFDWDVNALTVQGPLSLKTIVEHRNGVLHTSHSAC